MATQHTRYTIDEIADRGTELYETKIRTLVAADNVDRYLAIDVERGDYAVANVAPTIYIHLNAAFSCSRQAP